MRLISNNDFVVHMLGALIGLLATAFMIQAGRALHSRQAGWLAGLVFGTSGYAVYFLLEARGYGLLLMALAASVCFYARWLKRPTWGRAIPLVLAQTLALYTHFTSGLVFALMALHVLIAVPRRLWWRWAIIMAVTGLLFLPILPQFINSYQTRSAAFDGNNLPSYFLKGPESIYHAYSVYKDNWWASILFLAGLGLCMQIVRKPRQVSGLLLWFLLWGIGIPAYAYFTKESQGLFTTRYLVYTLPPIMLLIGIGLASLPNDKWMFGAILLAVFSTFPWQPFDHRPRYSDAPPVRDLMREMAKRFKTGDVLVIDPSINQDGYDWWYYEPLYFAGGQIPRATDGSAGQPRVWYLTRQGSEDAALRQSVETGRDMTEFWGPWYFIVSLYQGPPLTPGVKVGDTIRFRGVTLPNGTHYLPGDTLKVDTWWSADDPVLLDYSLGLHLFNSKGELVAQVDSGPTGTYTPAQTSAWEPGSVYRDERSMKLPWCIEPGEYEVRLLLYQSWDAAHLQPEPGEWLAVDDHLQLAAIQVDSFAYCHN